MPKRPSACARAADLLSAKAGQLLFGFGELRRRGSLKWRSPHSWLRGEGSLTAEFRGGWDRDTRVTPRKFRWCPRCNKLGLKRCAEIRMHRLCGSTARRLNPWGPSCLKSGSEFVRLRVYTARIVRRSTVIDVVRGPTVYNEATCGLMRKTMIAEQILCKMTGRNTSRSCAPGRKTPMNGWPRSGPARRRSSRPTKLGLLRRYSAVLFVTGADRAGKTR